MANPHVGDRAAHMVGPPYPNINQLSHLKKSFSFRIVRQDYAREFLLGQPDSFMQGKGCSTVCYQSPTSHVSDPIAEGSSVEEPLLQREESPNVKSEGHVAQPVAMRAPTLSLLRKQDQPGSWFFISEDRDSKIQRRELKPCDAVYRFNEEN